MKVIYIAGPYHAANSNQLRLNIQAAENLAALVWQAGFVALCPHTNNAFFDGIATDEIFFKGTIEMLSRCDGLILLPSWYESKGTIAELAYCLVANIPVYDSLTALNLNLPVNPQELGTLLDAAKDGMKETTAEGIA